jgi:hypothetical protein
MDKQLFYAFKWTFVTLAIYFTIVGKTFPLDFWFFLLKLIMHRNIMVVPWLG